MTASSPGAKFEVLDSWREGCWRFLAISVDGGDLATAAGSRFLRVAVERCERLVDGSIRAKALPRIVGKVHQVVSKQVPIRASELTLGQHPFTRADVLFELDVVRLA
jgi:hypothetical protein